MYQANLNGFLPISSGNGIAKMREYFAMWKFLIKFANNIKELFHVNK